MKPAKGFTIARAREADKAGWLGLRQALWPQPLQDHDAEAPPYLSGNTDVCFVAKTPNGHVIGFAEASLRQDYVNGCETSPVGFLEGIYVEPHARRQGVARHLAEAVAEWTCSKGCTELASDAEIGNLASHRMHQALGFSETERVVYFRKMLAP